SDNPPSSLVLHRPVCISYGLADFRWEAPAQWPANRLKTAPPVLERFNFLRIQQFINPHVIHLEVCREGIVVYALLPAPVASYCQIQEPMKPLIKRPGLISLPFVLEVE